MLYDLVAFEGTQKGVLSLYSCNNMVKVNLCIHPLHPMQVEGVLDQVYPVGIQELPSSKYSSIQSTFSSCSENVLDFFFVNNTKNQPTKQKSNKYFWA